MNLERLLRMTVPVGEGCVAPPDTPMSPDFRIAVQRVYENGGVHCVVHAMGHNSDTLDIVVIGNTVMSLEQFEARQRMLARAVNA